MTGLAAPAATGAAAGKTIAPSSAHAAERGASAKRNRAGAGGGSSSR
jgi:hypothetical protein